MKPNVLAKYDQRVPRYTSYPTAPHFSPKVMAEAYRQWLAELDPASPLSLYLHIPFCDSLCWFCGCHTKIVRRYAPVAAYLEVLRREIDLVAARLDGRLVVSHLHFGGGSPTILAPDDVTALIAHLRHRFDLDQGPDFAVEIDPREAGRDMIESWARAGLNRASLGVQDLNPEVQRAINREQSFECTAQVAAWLREAGVKRLNLDLMYGLPHQTVARVINTVERVLTLAPDRIALFGYAHLPRLKRHQRLIDEAALPDGAERWRQSEAAAGRLVAAGYVRIGIDHFARPDDDLARALTAGTLHRNFQGYTTDAAPALVGLGASAISSLPQGYVQNAVPIRRYAEAIVRGRLAAVRGIRLKDDDRTRRAVIERLMCDLQVDLDTADAGASAFAAELAALAPMAEDGLVEIDGGRLRVTEAGRPLLRSACAAFDTYLDAGRHSRPV